jgi:hypothetical protein
MNLASNTLVFEHDRLGWEDMMRFPLLLLCAMALPSSGQTRDWAAHPPIIERDAPATIFAIGDIHGDYDRLLRLLHAAGIIASEKATPKEAAWAAGDSVLVVTGDMIDKGPQPVAVVQFLRALQDEAIRHRGEVILLAGNHENEFLTGGAEKKKAEFAAELGKSGLSAKDAAACRGELGDWLCSLPIAARVGDWFFSHGGNTGGHTIADLAAQIRDGSYSLTDPNSLLEARLGEGKKWFASSDSSISEEQLLRSYAAKLGVKHMVQGHQHNAVKFDDGVERHTGEMFQHWGLLFLIDVGMSREIGDSQGAVLKITRNGAAAVCPDGAQTPLWDVAMKDDRGSAAICLK